MRSAVIVSTARTPIGRAYRGAFNDTQSQALGGHVIAEAVKRAGATPAEIVEKLNKEISAGLADPKIKSRLADLGGIALTGSPGDFGKLIVEETEKWGKVVKFVGIKAD